MKIIFAATSQIALKTFYSLHNSHEIAAVITQPNKPIGRSKTLIPSPIAEAAEKEKLKIFKPEKFEGILINELRNLKADIFLTFSYGVILKKNFLDITKKGGLNIHPSLLPKLRGPSPIKTAILLGLKKSGITIQKIELKVDSGDILYQEEFDISQEDNSITIEEKVSEIASNIINQVLNKFEKGEINIIQQNDSEITYCKLIKKEDGLINWNYAGIDIINKTRAFINWPIAFSYLNSNKLNIYNASINNTIKFDDYKRIENGTILFADKNNGLIVKSKDSLISIDKLQLRGKKTMNWKNFINGQRNLKNKILSNINHGEKNGTF